MANQDCFQCACGQTYWGKNGYRKVHEHIEKKKTPKCGNLVLQSGTKTTEKR